MTGKSAFRVLSLAGLFFSSARVFADDVAPAAAVTDAADGKAAFAEQLKEYLSNPANVEELKKSLADPAKPAQEQPKATDPNAKKAKAESKSLAEVIAPNSEAPFTPENPTWGEFDPGTGFVLGRTPRGELSLSAYALVRYLNQMADSDICARRGRRDLRVACGRARSRR
jgi:hypothetical protein